MRDLLDAGTERTRGDSLNEGWLSHGAGLPICLFYRAYTQHRAPLSRSEEGFCADCELGCVGR